MEQRICRQPWCAMYGNPMEARMTKNSNQAGGRLLQPHMRMHFGIVFWYYVYGVPGTR